MPKGKGYKDQFNLKSTESTLGKKRLSEQPKAGNSVPGAEAPSSVKPNLPSASRNVKGLPGK